MKRFVAMVAIIVVTGCATSPESIAPAYVSELSYQVYNCDQLGQEQERLSVALATTSDAQRHARSNDIAGVILLGLPVSSLSGSNQASQIARLKGELTAVQKTGIFKSCNLMLVQLTPPPATSDAVRTYDGNGHVITVKNAAPAATAPVTAAPKPAAGPGDEMTRIKAGLVPARVRDVTPEEAGLIRVPDPEPSP